MTLAQGANGAKPHHHKKSAEMFYVLDGRMEVLSGKEILKAEAGDVIVVPPLVTHVFAADRGSSADLLIIIAPGVERFEYFRHLTRIAHGEEKPESLRDKCALLPSGYLRRKAQTELLSSPRGRQRHADSRMGNLAHIQHLYRRNAHKSRRAGQITC